MHAGACTNCGCSILSSILSVGRLPTCLGTFTKPCILVLETRPATVVMASSLQGDRALANEVQVNCHPRVLVVVFSLGLLGKQQRRGETAKMLIIT